MKLNLMAMIIGFLLLSGCANQTLEAPADAACCRKIKINQW